MIRLLLAAVALSLTIVQPACAGPLDEAKAQAHLDGVAAGNLEAIMRDYPEDAYLDWVGGPLDGRYRGKAAIRAAWEKFIALNNGKPRPAKFGKLESYTNPKGASIEAEAEYGGAVPVKVWHVLVYRNGVLATELWQIAPALHVEP